MTASRNVHLFIFCVEIQTILESKRELMQSVNITDDQDKSIVLYKYIPGGPTTGQIVCCHID